MIKIDKLYNCYPDCLDFHDVENQIDALLDSKCVFSWDIVNYKEIEQYLLTLYNNKCAYCEKKLDQPEIMHYRPYAGENACDAYTSLAYEWSNILLVCPKCKKLKGNKFPIISKGNKLISKISKESRKPNVPPLKDEIPIIINPEIEYPEEHFIYNPLNGYMVHLNERAQKTINTFELNRWAIERKAISDCVFRKIKKILIRYLENSLDKDYIEDLSELFQDIINNTNPEYEYSGYYKYLANHFYFFAEKNIPTIEYRTELIFAFENFKKGKQIIPSIKSIIYLKNNTMSIEGNGNISLQDIDGSTITINYNDEERIKKIIEKFTLSQLKENQYIALELEKFFYQIRYLRTNIRESADIINEIKKETRIYNANIDLIIRKLNNDLKSGIDDIKQLLNIIITDILVLKNEQDAIKEQLNAHFLYLMEIPVNKTKSKEIQHEIEDLIKELNNNFAEGLSDLLTQFFDYIDIHIKELDQKQQQIYKDLKKSDNWQTKVKLIVPLINLIGLNLEHEIKLNNLIKNIRKRK